MFPSARLSIKIPDSPIEQKTFRSRPFRRFVIAACCLFLFVATLHSVSLQNELHHKLADKYLTFHNNRDGSSWLSKSHIIDNVQSTFTAKGKMPGDRPATVEEKIKHLPEIVRIPFEQAVDDVELHGWEDAWFSTATFDYEKHGPLPAPKIDFIYNWVNGSETGFTDVKSKWELSSPLNDKDGRWRAKHSINRYRDWDELRYSFRSLDKYAKTFINKIQLLVNKVQDTTLVDDGLRPQRPTWLRDDEETRQSVQVLAQEDFFSQPEKECLPSFDSVSIESQIHNTPSNVDQAVALSDDMFLGAQHSAADFYSPLFGSMMGFKQDHYNVKDINKADVPTFGEKPYLYFTSWLLNHRFGDRDRKAQAHFTHSISRRVMKEAMTSFPGPALRGACERFRGESKFQIYPWYVAFHYSIERFREALLWSFVMTRGDANGDYYLDWNERQMMIEAFQPGKHALGGGDASTPVHTVAGRDRMFYKLPQTLRQAGLEPPMSNVNVLWTSLDGPETIRNVKCHGFHIAKCFTESFDSPVSDAAYPNPDFSASNIFTQLAQREPRCGDCLIKFMLSTTPRGLEPMLPPKSNPSDREMVIKALVKYQHTVFEPEAMFVMVKDAEQAEHELLESAIRRNKHVGQWCLNDDVMTDDERAVSKVNGVIQTVFRTLFPAKGRWET